MVCFVVPFKRNPLAFGLLALSLCVGTMATSHAAQPNASQQDAWSTARQSVPQAITPAQTLESPQDTDATLQEARQFLTLMRKSSNTVLRALAIQQLERLAQPTQPTTIAPVAEAPLTVEVPLMVRSNANLIVSGVMNDKARGAFIVDTGATYTVITPDFARRAGIRTNANSPSIRIVTANGEVDAPMVRVASLRVGALTLRNLDVVIQPLGDDPLLTGLLGMNFFKGTEFSCNDKRLAITLENPAHDAVVHTGTSTPDILAVIPASKPGRTGHTPIATSHPATSSNLFNKGAYAAIHQQSWHQVSNESEMGITP